MRLPDPKPIVRALAEVPVTLAQHARNRASFRAVASPYKVLWLNPHEVDACVRGEIARRTTILGTILEGDWDLDVTPFADSPTWRGITEHFRDRVPWERTALFAWYRERLTGGKKVRGCRSIEELVGQYERRIEPMYRDMASDGFRHPFRYWSARDGLCLLIGRAGQFIVGRNGNHRLAIAQLLNLDRIPVRILARNAEWQRRRERAARGEVNGLAHPDLADLRAE